MTDYITKLYELAGVQKGFYAYQYENEDSYTGFPIYSGKKKFFTTYEKAREEYYSVPYYVENDEEYYFEYPEFTVEKQLELLLLFNRDFTVTIQNQEDEFCVNTKKYSSDNLNNFADAIAQLTCKMLEAKYYSTADIREILEK